MNIVAQMTVISDKARGLFFFPSCPIYINSSINFSPVKTEWGKKCDFIKISKIKNLSLVQEIRSLLGKVQYKYGGWMCSEPDFYAGNLDL